MVTGDDPAEFDEAITDPEDSMSRGSRVSRRPVAPFPECPPAGKGVFAADARSRLHVLKFGSSVLANPPAYRSAAGEVRAEVAGGAKVVVVVSAMGATTDTLLACARAVTESPPDALVGALLATGEEASSALFALALMAVGVPALRLSSWHLPIHTRGRRPAGRRSGGCRRRDDHDRLRVAQRRRAPGFRGPGRERRALAPGAGAGRT